MLRSIGTDLVVGAHAVRGQSEVDAAVAGGVAFAQSAPQVVDEISVAAQTLDVGLWRGDHLRPLGIQVRPFLVASPEPDTAVGHHAVVDRAIGVALRSRWASAEQNAQAE